MSFDCYFDFVDQSLDLLAHPNIHHRQLMSQMIPFQIKISFSEIKQNVRKKFRFYFFFVSA